MFLLLFTFNFLAMGLHVNDDEFTPLGDFLMVSFERDQRDMEVKFSNLNRPFLEGFQGKLQEVKDLEGTLGLTEEQKGVTKSLNGEAAAVNDELNFLSIYMDDAGLSTKAVTVLKRSLHDGDIEGGLLELRDVIQFARGNKDALEAKGMDSRFLDDLDARKVSMAAKNAMQNTVMNRRKQLVEDNQEDYDALYAYISEVAKKGKVFYKGKGKEDEYTITKIVARMRAPDRGDDDEV